MSRIQVGRPRIRHPISGTLKVPFRLQIFPTNSSSHAAFFLLVTGAIYPRVERRAVEAITHLHLVAMLRMRGTPRVFSLCKAKSKKNSLIRNKKCKYRISLFLRSISMFKNLVLRKLRGKKVFCNVTFRKLWSNNRRPIYWCINNWQFVVTKKRQYCSY
jgi:hypothetical protein